MFDLRLKEGIKRGSSIVKYLLQMALSSPA